MTIRLVVLDIDGVMTDGEARPLDLPLLAELRALNRAAQADESRPAVTICTGRPAPYAEALLQAIDGHLPAIFENGAGLYVPSGYRFFPHPELAEQAIPMSAIRQRLAETLVQGGQAYFQPGKEYSLTLFATDPAQTAALASLTAAALGPLAAGVDLVFSVSCLNVLPRHIHKGKGVAFLARETGFATAEMLGVGDSEVDWEFLRLVGYSAAPANAVAEIKQAVDYVSPEATSAGVRDILHHFGVV